MRIRSQFRARLLVASVGFAATTALASPPGAGEDVRVEEISTWDRIEADASLERRTRSVARLLTPAGVAAWSEVGTTYMEASQEADITVLRIFKADGREIDVLPTAPRSVAPLLPPGLPIHSDLRVVRLAVPALEVGDRIVLESRSRSRPIAEGQVWAEYDFAGPPESAQLYELDVPEGLALIVRPRPDLEAALEETLAEGRRVRRWTLPPRPGAPDANEEQGGAEADAEEAGEAEVREPDVQVSSFTSWEELVRWWGSLAPIETPKALRSKAEELLRGITDPEARLRALHRFVASEIRYLSLPLGLGRYRARPVEEILATGLGDCKDKHRLLASLAAASGIAVEPFLLNVEGRAIREDVPSPLHFDHVISRARVGEKEVWIDATSEMTPTGWLPPEDRDVRGVLVVDAAAGGHRMLSTPAGTPEETSVRIETTGSIDEEGIERLRERWTMRGDEEAWRLAFKYGTDEDRRAVVRELTRNWKESVVAGAPTFADPDDLDRPFWVEYTLEHKRAVPWSASWEMRVPVPVVELERQTIDGRIDLGSPRRQARSVRVEVPAGVRIVTPIPVSMSRDFAEFRSEYRAEGGALVVERELVRKLDSLPAGREADLEAFEDAIEKDWLQRFTLQAPPELVARAVAPPEDADALNNRCNEEISAARYAEAERLCRRATELAPEHGFAWNNLGRALSRLGRLDEAVAAHERQIELVPNDKYSYSNLAAIHWQRGDLGRAEELLRKQIDVAPFEAYPYGALGRILLGASRYDEAERMLGHALKLSPTDPEILIDAFRLDISRERAELVRARVQASPEVGERLYEHGRAALLLLSKSEEGAAGPWAPLRPWVQSLVSRSEAELKDLSDPRPSTQAIAATTFLAASWEILGRIELEEGRPAAAVPYFESSLRLNPTPGAAARLAEALRSSGDGARADAELALATVLGADGSRYQPAFDAAVASPAERRALQAAARETSWKLRSLTRQSPAAAGNQGRLWLLFEPDGRLRSAAAEDESGPRVLAAGLNRMPPSLPMPPGNRARIPVRATAHCSASGDCTIVLDALMQIWFDLAAQQAPPAAAP